MKGKIKMQENKNEELNLDELNLEDLDVNVNSDTEVEIQDEKSKSNDLLDTSEDLEKIMDEAGNKDKKKQAIKTSDKKQANKSCHKKQNKKTLENIEKIREYLSKNNISKTSDIAEYIGLSLPRTRAILKEIPDVSPIGNNSNRKWTLQK